MTRAIGHAAASPPISIPRSSRERGDRPLAGDDVGATLGEAGGRCRPVDDHGMEREQLVLEGLVDRGPDLVVPPVRRPVDVTRRTVGRWSRYGDGKASSIVTRS